MLPNLTSAGARIMLPAYPILFTPLGCLLLFTPTRVLDRTPAWEALDHVMPLWLYGSFVVVACAIQVIALTGTSRDLEVLGLALLGILMVALAVVSWVGAVAQHTALTVGILPLLAATACTASGVSVTAGDNR